MEASTKERLTGALIVVLALVVVAPELLTGRHPPEPGPPAAQDPEDGAPLQTFSIQLDAAATASAAARDVPEEPEPAPAMPLPEAEAPGPALAAVEEVPVPATQVNAPPAREVARPAAPATPPKTPATTTPGKWWVQVGSFSSGDNARRLARELSAAGFNVEVARGSSSGKELFRVRTGPVADRAAAEALRSRLIASGQKNPSLIAP